jgi:hypothetical protein
MPNIVNVVVTQQVAPAPSTLQSTGALISQGATTLASGTCQLLTQVSDLSSILTGSVAISTITWATNVATVTTASAHGIPSGDTVQVTITGVLPVGYNGTFSATSTGTTTFTYSLLSNPGSYVSGGTETLEDVTELVAMVNTFFAQGTTQSVYVLELGVGSPAQGVTALQSYIASSNGHTTTSSTPQFYSFLLPKTWDTETTAQTMASSFDGTTAQTYFYVTTTLATYSNWTGKKSVFATVQSPSAPITEFSAASIFQVTLSYNPSASNLAHPLAFTYVYGVTAYSTLTNANQVALKAAGVNWIGTGAQGGISNTCIFYGTFMDVNPFNYWYCVDWLSINVAQALANAVINGSNLPTNPLYYNQAGINTLQKVAQATVNNGISFGLILSPATVQAVPFTTYVAQHPSDYATGTYNGLSLTFVPLRGFTSITIYLTASNIPV